MHHHRNVLPLLTCFVAATALVAGLAPASTAASLQPSEVYTQLPDDAGIAYDDVSFQTVDGLTLHGWFIPFQDQEGNPDRFPAPLIVVPAAAEGNMGGMLWHYAMLFRGAPWHVLMFDWRGFGTSDPWPVARGSVVMAEFIRDLNAALDYAKTREEWDHQHLAIFALEMGAAVAMAVAAERDDLACLATRGLYSTQEELVRNETVAASVGAVGSGGGGAREGQAVGGREGGAGGAGGDVASPPEPSRVNPEYPEALEPIRVAPKVEEPVFIAVGEEDAITPPSMAERICDALAGRCHMWTAPESGHSYPDYPELVNLTEFTANLHSFLRRYVGVGR